MRNFVMEYVKNINCTKCGSSRLLSEGDYLSYICTDCGTSGTLRSDERFMAKIMFLKLPCSTVNYDAARLDNLPRGAEKHEVFEVPMLDESGCFITLARWEAAGVEYSSIFKFKKEVQRCERNLEDDMLMRAYERIKNIKSLHDY